MEYDEKKHSYDSTALQLQSNMSKVEGEVNIALCVRLNRKWELGIFTKMQLQSKMSKMEGEVKSKH